MIGRRAIVGLCMLCALLVSAFAAQGASAATNGTTAFTCKEVTPAAGTAGYKDAHCKEAVSTEAKYELFPFEGETAITGNGETTFLHSVISGVNVELESTNLTGSGTMENMKAASGEHTANGTGKIEYKEVTVVKPAGKGCEVEGKEVKTASLKATTAGQGMGLKFEPAEGETFASFNVKGCAGSKALEALNGPYTVTGSVVGTPEGATTVTTAAGTTAQGTLKLRGQNAGISGSLTIKGANGSGLVAQTVETP